MNRKGQALIEFVLILPVFLFILFAVIDFGVIFSVTNELESDSSDIINLFKKGTSITELEELYDDNKIVIVQDEDNYYRFSISRNIKLITPGFNRIFGEPYVVNIERVVPYV